MSGNKGLSRRQFLSQTITTATASGVLASYPVLGKAFAQSPAARLTPGMGKNAAHADQGVLYLNKSPYAKLHNVPVHAVTIRDGFWAKRRKTNVESSIPSMREQLLAHGRMDNFLRLTGKSSASQRGPYYSDSDIYKWTEAVGFALQSDPNSTLRAETDQMIREVVAAQEPSGYLNTYYVGDRASERMLPHSQEVGHELYNIGHLLQGAIAYYRATGDSTLLDAGVRFLNGFLLPSYGPGANQKPIVAGHPEIEMALIETYRTTGDERYLHLAGYILHGDNRIPLEHRQIVYMFCGIPFSSRTKLEGHAVRAMYACCGATDYYLETGDQTYWETLNHLWEDLVSHQMYVTGGVGARSQGEAFGEPYELPNARAYGESCAAIGNMMWNWRMLAASGEAKFADVIERALYNGINSGMSLDGTTYCYRNPLAFDPSDGDKIRNPWYDTTCCPPNLERTFASLPGYFYSTSKDGLYVHLYDNSELKWHLEDGTPLNVVQKTNYPWSGDVELTVSPAAAKSFTVYLRIPGWAQQANVLVNGTKISGVRPGHYLSLDREWKAGDKIQLQMEMHPQLISANPQVTEDLGRVALQRGPLVYCMEGLDQSADASLSDFHLVEDVQTEQHYQEVYEANLLDGVMTLRYSGALSSASSARPLYAPLVLSSTKPDPASLTFIPYYAWANRKPSQMQVWVPYQRA